MPRLQLLPILLLAALALPAQAQRSAASAPAAPTLDRAPTLSQATPAALTKSTYAAARSQNGGTELIVDGSFEAGTPSAAWTEAATSDTPICSAADCANPAPDPRTGGWYAFFGGEGIDNESSVSQSVTIPSSATSALLSFWVQIGVGGNGTGSFSLFVDNLSVQTITEADAAAFSDYMQINVDLSAFADGQPRTISFRATEQAGTANGSFATFLLDDVSLITTGAPPPPPPGGTLLNDGAWQAMPIWAGQTTYTGTNVGATDGQGQPGDSDLSASCTAISTNNDSDQSVWWVFAATANGTVNIDLDGSDFDTILSVLSLDGFDFEASFEVGCNDDDPNNGPGDFTSALAVSVVENNLYLVRVSGFGVGPSSSGQIQMTVSGAPITGPPNDRNGRIEPGFNLFLRENGLYADTNIGATVSVVETTARSCGGAVTGTIWRAFRVPTDGTVTLDLAGSDFDTVVALYDQAAGFTEVACNDDRPSGPTSLLTDVPVLAGQLYEVQVSGFNGAQGQVRLAYTFTPNPSVAGEDGPEEGVTFLAPAPNPASGLVRLAVETAEASDARVEVFDALGRRAAVIHDGVIAAGPTSWSWDASGQPAGVYVVRMTTASGEVRTQTVTVAR